MILSEARRAPRAKLHIKRVAKGRHSSNVARAKHKYARNAHNQSANRGRKKDLGIRELARETRIIPNTQRPHYLQCISYTTMRSFRHCGLARDGRPYRANVTGLRNDRGGESRSLHVGLTPAPTLLRSCTPGLPRGCQSRAAPRLSLPCWRSTTLSMYVRLGLALPGGGHVSKPQLQ